MNRRGLLEFVASHAGDGLKVGKRRACFQAFSLCAPLTNFVPFCALYLMRWRTKRKSSVCIAVGEDNWLTLVALHSMMIDVVWMRR